MDITLKIKYKYKKNCTKSYISFVLCGCALWNSNEYCGIIFNQMLILNKYALKNGFI